MKDIIYIAGAHSRGRTFKEYISKLYPNTRVAAFLVDDLSENEAVVDGLPVIEISEESGLNPAFPVYLATRGVYHEKLTLALRSAGMREIIPVDISLDRMLRNQYVQKCFEEKGIPFRLLDEEICFEKSEVADSFKRKKIPAAVYVASSAFDEILTDFYDNKEYEKTIQVGAALTDVRIEAAVCDNEGDHISHKNQQYCELTALYWIWKNAKEEIVGLVHYRRHFLLPDSWITYMERESIDVILPVPLFVVPSVAENYMQRHSEKEWKLALEYLKQNDKDMYTKAVEIFADGLYCPCNMLITRKEVLCELCAWLFPLLDFVVCQSGKREDAYQNRYPGFLAERMMTLFFAYHVDSYKFAFANKNFLK